MLTERYNAYKMAETTEGNKGTEKDINKQTKDEKKGEERTK
jgi:hypothetical protein